MNPSGSPPIFCHDGCQSTAPPVVVISGPQARSRGPRPMPVRMARFTQTSTANWLPPLTAPVYPASRSCPAWRRAAIPMKTGGYFMSISFEFFGYVKFRWTWPSIRPGITVWPVASISSQASPVLARRLTSAVGPTASMRPSVMRTAWPGRASAPLPSIRVASAIRYRCIVRPPALSAGVGPRCPCIADRLPDAVRCERHVQVLDAERMQGIQHRVHERGDRADGAGLADALGAEGVVRVRGNGVVDEEVPGHRVGARNGVVHQRRAQELPRLVVARFFQQDLAQA